MLKLPNILQVIMNIGKDKLFGFSFGRGSFLIRHRCAGVLILMLLLGLCEVASGKDAQPPVNVFFDLPKVSRPRVSPDGTKIAFLLSHESRMALGVLDRKDNTARMILQGKDESLLGFFWKGNERLVFYADYQGNESAFVGSTDLSGKKIVRLVETQGRWRYLGGSSGGILDELESDPDRIIMNGILRSSAPRPGESSIVDLPWNLDAIVAKVNVRSRAITNIYTFGSERIHSLLVDNAGTLRLRARMELGDDRVDLIWEHRETDGKAWREIARHPWHGYAENWEPISFAADNQTLYLLSREENDRGALHVFDTRTLRLGPALFTPPAGEIQRIILSRDRTKLLGVQFEAEKVQHHWFDGERAKLQQMLENSLPGMDVRVVSSSIDGQVHVVWAGSDREPGVYFVLDRKAGSMNTLERVRNIDPAMMRPMQSVRFTARDGLELHGYLTLPKSAVGGRRVPLIIHPHGGPFGVRDSWGFNPEVQFLASRGYAVLQVNFRGSGGYGRAFLDKGRQQWGRAMQDDLSDAVQWAVSKGIADPKRVAIYGASYGGYAALAGVTLTPELYACAVNYVGVSDLELAFKWMGDDAFMTAKEQKFSYQQVWVGPDKAYRDPASPINFVERIRVPTLHAYGSNDPRVEIDHWSRLERLLKLHGKPYVGIKRRDQGHGFRDEQASLSFYSAMETFLAEHLAPERP